MKSPDQRFEAVYRAHYAEVLRFLARRTPDAEELAAETFAVAWRRLEDVPDGHELPWLLVAARNVLHNHRRALERRAEKTRRAGEGAVRHAPDPAEAFAERDLILRAFVALSERDRETLRLVVWEGLSQADAARVAGTTRVAFAVRASRARRRLARALEELERAPALRPQETSL